MILLAINDLCNRWWRV